MAYRAFDGWPVIAVAETSARLESVFNPLELSVLVLARADDASSLAEPGPLRRLARAVFGARPGKALANPRLEALRRFAVVTRDRAAPPPGEAERLLAAGFTSLQLQLIARDAAREITAR